MFFRNLFDLKFERFVTRQVASVLYAILVFGAAAALIIGSIAAIGRGQGGVVVAAPIAYLLFVIVLRVLFESSIALISIAENTKK